MGQCDFVQALQVLDNLLIDDQFRPYAPLIDQMIFLTACEARSFYSGLCTVSQQLLHHNMPIPVHAIKDTFEQKISNDITRYGVGLSRLWKFASMGDNSSKHLRKRGGKNEKDVVRLMGHMWQQLLSDLPQLGDCTGEMLTVADQSSISRDSVSLNSMQTGQHHQFTQMLSSKKTSWIDKIECLVADVSGNGGDLHDLDRFMAGTLLWLVVLLKKAIATTTRSEMEIELSRYCMYILQNDSYRPFLRSSIQARILFLLSQTVSVQAVSLKHSYIVLALEQHPQFMYAKELFDHVQKSRFHRSIRECCPKSVFYARMIGIDYSRPTKVRPIGGWKGSVKDLLTERMHCNLSRIRVRSTEPAGSNAGMCVAPRSQEGQQSIPDIGQNLRYYTTGSR